MVNDDDFSAYEDLLDNAEGYIGELSGGGGDENVFSEVLDDPRQKSEVKFAEDADEDLYTPAQAMRILGLSRSNYIKKVRLWI